MGGFSMILIVVTGMFALGILVLSYFIITPVFLQLHNDPAWQRLNSSMGNRLNQQYYNDYFIMIPLFAGATIMAIYARAGRKDTVEESSGDTF